MSDITPESLVIASPRPRGRPRSPEPGSVLSAYVPQKYHDRIAQLAVKHDVSVSKVVCRLLDEALRVKV